MTIPKDYTDCYLALYKINEDGTIDSTYIKPIVRATRTSGEQLDFYGVRASKYGIKVPTGSQEWGIFHYDGSEFKLLVSGQIPEPSTKRIHELSDGRIIYVRRAKSNLSISMSMYPKSFKSITI
jgi:hypothetical protein